jgi:hypothetical protein
MAGFYFRLELEDGSPADPARAAHGCTELGPQRHDPVWACERDSAGGGDPPHSRPG